jgi:hypothetical protein
MGTDLTACSLSVMGSLGGVYLFCIQKLKFL